jgi:hypothetical protein
VTVASQAVLLSTEIDAPHAPLDDVRERFGAVPRAAGV